MRRRTLTVRLGAADEALLSAAARQLGTNRSEVARRAIREFCARIAPPKSNDLRSLRGILKPKRKGVTLDDMDEALRDGVVARFRGK